MKHGLHHRPRTKAGLVFGLTPLCSALLFAVALASPILPDARSVRLPIHSNGSFNLELSEFSGIVMNGQTLSVDFLFENPIEITDGIVRSGVLLAESSDTQPGQSVIFGAETRAYLIDQN